MRPARLWQRQPPALRPACRPAAVGPRAAAAAPAPALTAPTPAPAAPIHPPAAPAPAPAAPARPLVVLNRVTGIDPQADTITVEVDGRVLVRRLRGGAGGRLDRFTLSPAEVRRLRRTLGPLRGRHVPEPDQDLDRYALRVGHTRPLGFVEREVPRFARPAVTALERLIDTSGRRGGADQRSHEPGAT